MYYHSPESLVQGFMGEVVELVGEFECDYTPLNRVYHFLSRIKNHG